MITRNKTPDKYQARIAELESENENLESLVEQLDEAMCSMLHRGDELGEHSPETHLALFYKRKAAKCGFGLVVDAGFGLSVDAKGSAGLQLCTSAERAVLDAMAEFTEEDIVTLQTDGYDQPQHWRFVSLGDAELARREAEKCSG
jgi:hypothetical protein